MSRTRTLTTARTLDVRVDHASTPAAERVLDALCKPTLTDAEWDTLNADWHAWEVSTGSASA